MFCWHCCLSYGVCQEPTNSHLCTCTERQILIVSHEVFTLQLTTVTSACYVPVKTYFVSDWCVYVDHMVNRN